MRRAFAFAALALCLLAPLPMREIRTEAATPARAECVAEVTSRRFLHARNEDAELPMASTTKILTACIVIEDCPLDEVVTVPKEAERTEGSSVYLRAGEQYTVRDLLYGLMLRSGNDCAVTLALHHSGSIEAFAQVMTERAHAMGAEKSYFMNPHGLPDGRHRTTARDLALVAAYAMEHETFREIVSCKYYEPRGWKNKNKMLWEYEGATGIKTGETYERTAELLDAAFSSYGMCKLCDASAGYEGYAIKYDFSYPLTAEERRALEFRTVSLMPLPEEHGALAGQMEIYLENNLIFSQNLFII